MSVEFFGIYEKTLFRDEKNAATYFSMKIQEPIKERNRYGCIIVSAHIPEYTTGLPIYVSGEWTSSQRGPLLKAKTVKEEAWNKVFTASYLSCACNGISYKTCCNLVEKYGQSVFDCLCHKTPAEICMGVRGLTERKAAKLSEAVGATIVQRETFEFILHYGGLYTSAVKLCKEYGSSAKKKLCEDPFGVGMKFGLTFEQCDLIARDMGGHAASEKRIAAAANAIMNRNTQNGNVYICQNALLQKMEALLEKSVYPEPLPTSVLVNGILRNDNLFVEQDKQPRVFQTSLRFAEINTALQIKRLMETSQSLGFKDSLVDKVQKSCNIQYAPQQREAFQCLNQTGIAVITGGPGTGKTTVINGIITAYELLHPDKTVRLCAPTGRAAQRMMESTGKVAVTLHRLLEYRPFGNNGEVTHKTADDPIDADFIVVDESSMLDVDLANIFLSAVKSGTLVLFVGDINQLPSVGAGNVLHDFIQSNRIPVYRLTTIYRQAKESPIVANAFAINSGSDELIRNEEFLVGFAKSPEKVKLAVMELVRKLYNKADPFETQVLVSTYKGESGVNVLNRELQAIVNPRDENKKELKYGSRIFREGDKVLMLNNNYEAGYYNGDLGSIVRIDGGNMFIRLLDKQICLTHEMFDDVNLAYAMSVHKSQGSEFPNVIIALPYEPMTMLKRNLLYTAITRAKRTVFLVSENGALAKAVATGETGKRKTRLADRLKEMIKPTEGREGITKQSDPAA